VRSDIAGLLDRDREAAAVEDLLSGAAEGAGRLVVISGGAGVGKTALLEAAAGRARRRGFTVLVARGSRSERELPFGLVSRLFEPVSPGLSESELEPVFGRPRRTTRLSGAQPVDSSAPADDDASLADLYALHRALALLAADAPVLLAIDDLQLLDRPSLRWLSTLPQRLHHAPVAVLATMCAGEPPVDREILDELLAGSSHELRPADLSVSATAEILERSLAVSPDLPFVAACMRATGGNPLLLTALAGALEEQAVSPIGDATATLADLVVPGLAPVVHTRLRRLSPNALTVARAVAVLNGAASLSRVTHITGLDPATVSDVAATLRRAGLLTLTDQVVTFTYPLLRSTIMQELPFTALQTVHATAGRLLHESGASAADIAEQLIAARPLGEAWVPGVLIEAAKEAISRGMPDTAVAHLRRALDEPMPDDARTALLISLGRAEAHVDMVSATRHLTEAVDRTEPSHRRGHLVAELATLLGLLGFDRTATELIAAKADTPAVGTPPWLIEAQLRSAATAPAATEQLNQLRPPIPTGGPDEARVLSLLAQREAWAGENLNTAIEYAEQALAAAPATPDATASYLRAVHVLAQAGRIEDAYERCDALVLSAERWQHRPCLAAARSARSVTARMLGRLPAAADDARTGLDLLVSCGATRRAGAAVEFLARLVQVLVDLGGHDEALNLIELSELDRAVPRTWAGTTLLLARGRLSIAAGEPADGVRDLLAAGELLAAWNATNPAVAPWRSDLALALHSMGDKTKARRHITEEVELARRWGAPGPLGNALRIQGEVVRGPLGLVALEESVSVLEQTTSHHDLARSLTEYGVALDRARRGVPAREALRSAVELAEECGSSELAHRARAALTASGGRPKARRDGPAGLTASERRTTTLAAAGKTNREIATILFVQMRTVEIHLTNAYRKLGIDGREQLAAALEGSDPVTLAAG